MPTIVFGYFALTFITPTLLQDILGLDVSVFNALAAGLIMGFMIVPTIASISEDAMSAVPQGLREGAYGLGSTKRQVATRVVFPAAISGDRRLDRARHLPRRRRDDDRPDRRGPAAELQPQPARARMRP